jgi:hypothetical protein
VADKGSACLILQATETGIPSQNVRLTDGQSAPNMLLFAVGDLLLPIIGSGAQ